MPLYIDEDNWPIAKLIYKGVNGPDEMHSSIRFYQRMFVRNQRFCVIVDTRESQQPALSEMRVFSAFTKKHHDDFKTFCGGVAFILSGGVLIRMALRAMMQIAAPPFPQHTCTEMAEAEQWCRSQLQAQTDTYRSPPP